MSRFTSSPFHKPSPYDLYPSVQPISPPETTTDDVPPIHTSVSVPVTISARTEANLESLPPAPSLEIPNPPYRRTSSLTYNPPSLRESHERSSPRGSKPLIVVVPPPILVQDDGQLGHTLSSGHRHRLSQGILIPLFPTMYAQLTAIAREFNFPSTAGLCLYLQISDGGVLVTPRISDDAWPSIWTNALESLSRPPVNPPTSLLNISGRFELDIDLQRARWYHTWHSRRSSGDVLIPTGVPLPRSISHSRLDSRTTNTEEPASENWSENVAVQRRPTRHVPKMLSLVDRFDVLATQSGSRQAEIHGGTHILSPIVQVDEPQTAQQDLERRVNSWMAGASFTPAPLSLRVNYQPSDIPASPSLDHYVSPQDQKAPELNLDEFSWSESSPSPSSYASVVSQDRLPSVHIADRMELSVGLTPSACTSFGPADFDVYSPLSMVNRSPFVDLAQCMIEVVPLTPSTATSWGPPSWPASPLSMTAPRSVNLGDRGEWSVPASPSDATSWGPPSSYPPSPCSPYYISTPDIGQRNFDSSPSTAQPVVWNHVWPYCSGRSTLAREQSTSAPFLQTPPENLRLQYSKEHGLLRNPSGGSNKVFTYPYDSEENKFRSYVWPYYQPTLDNPQSREVGRTMIGSQRPLPLDSQSSYPKFDIYPDSRSDHGPPCDNPSSSHVNINVTIQYPVFDLYPVVYPNVIPYPPKQGEFYWCNAQNSQYPTFNIYPTIISSSKLRPSTRATVTASSNLDTTVCQSCPAYPRFQLYPPVYPHFDIYPHKAGSLEVDTSVDNNISRSEYQKPSQYPVFDLYPAVYPYFNLYPADPRGSEELASIVGTLAGYPAFNLYPAVSPHSDLHPEISSKASEDLHEVCSGHQDPSAASYPSFNLYPAMYPNFDLWPSLLPAGSLPDDESRPPKAHEPGQMAHLNRVTTTTGVASRPKPRRSHLDLHLSVFPDGRVVTPSGTISEHGMPSFTVTEPPQQDFVARAKPLHVLTRALSAPEGRVAGPRSRSGSIRRPTSEVLLTVKKLPLVPDHLLSPGTSPTRPPSPRSPDAKPRIRKLPPTPSSLRGPPISHYLSESTNGGAQGHADTVGLPHCDTHHPPSRSPLTMSAGGVRRNPVDLLPRPGSHTFGGFERLSPLSEPSPVSSPSSQRRDSLVLHRMKAYNSRSPPSSDLEEMDLPDPFAEFTRQSPLRLTRPVSKLVLAKYGF